MTPKELADLLRAQEWTYAKTMPQWPHHYLVRGKAPIDFSKVVAAIYEHAVATKWGNQPRTYFYADGFHYWCMGAPVAETTIINRARADYGAMVGGETNFYDGLAEGYDDHYQTAEAHTEDKAAFVAADLKGKVLDVGCGTGLIYDHLATPWPIEDYTGIDPSREMLEIFTAKHPDVDESLHVSTMSDWNLTGYDTIIAMFGVGSYLSASDMVKIKAALNPEGHAFIMSYQHGYTPFIYRAKGISAPLNDFTNLETLFGKYTVTRIEP